MINQLIAQLLDGFKLKNPKIFAGAITALVLIYIGIDQGLARELFGTSELLDNVTKYVLLALSVLTNSSTYPFNPKNNVNNDNK